MVGQQQQLQTCRRPSTLPTFPAPTAAATRDRFCCFRWSFFLLVAAFIVLPTILASQLPLAFRSASRTYNTRLTHNSTHPQQPRSITAPAPTPAPAPAATAARQHDSRSNSSNSSRPAASQADNAAPAAAPPPAAAPAAAEPAATLAMSSTLPPTLVRPRVVLFGDSLTQYGFEPDGGWGAALAHHLQRRVDVLNRGMAGYNSRWALKAFNQVLAEATAGGQQQVLLLTIWLGANDAAIPGRSAEVQAVPVPEYVSSLSSMVSSARAAGIPNILLLTPPPVDDAGRVRHQQQVQGVTTPLLPNKSLAHTQAYASAVVSLASRLGLPCVDLFTRLQALPGWREGTLLKDGLHFTPAGSRAVWREVQQVLAREMPQLSPEALPTQFPLWDQLDHKNFEQYWADTLPRLTRPPPPPAVDKAAATASAEAAAAAVDKAAATASAEAAAAAVDKAAATASAEAAAAAAVDKAAATASAEAAAAAAVDKAAATASAEAAAEAAVPAATAVAAAAPGQPAAGNASCPQQAGLVRPAVVLFGDSLTQYALDPDGGWGAALADHLQGRADVFSRGHSGYNSRWGLKVFEQVLKQLQGQQVLLLTIWLGANDAAIPGRSAEVQAVPVPEYVSSLSSMVSSARAAGIPNILLITPPPVDDAGRVRHQQQKLGITTPVLPDRTLAHTQQYASAVVSVASRLGVPCVDLFTRLQGLPGWQESLLKDGLHFTPAGSRAVWREVLAVLQKEKPQLSPESLPAQFPLWDQPDYAGFEKAWEEAEAHMKHRAAAS